MSYSQNRESVLKFELESEVVEIQQPELEPELAF